MVRTKDGDGINSGIIVTEVQKRPCLYDSNDMNYGDRAEKMKSWDEVYASVVPGWSGLSQEERSTAGKEVQKRWRSIRDSYTKAFRQGKCPPPEQCGPGSRRYQYHRQMSFLLKALQNKKPRYSQDKYESFSEVSNSPQHPAPEDVPRVKNEITDKPLDLKTKPETAERPETQDKYSQASIDKKLDIADATNILPNDHFDDDKLFMNSLLPLFKKMTDDTRLLCRIEVLKIIRYALQGNQAFDTPKMNEDNFKQVNVVENKAENTLSMTTRSADGSRPIRKRRARSPSPLPVPPKRRGPGRPRKIRPPPSDSDEDVPHKRFPKLKTSVDSHDEDYNKATSVAQLSTPMFMKMYNLERSKVAPITPPQSMLVSVKTEPLDTQSVNPI
ncbi:unnamed protein product [Danaus chrysippus]|uniref:(African queen) hypothetical protein n=1 Tax=Danaus chrysippus TaxID=151541 RepID=A0A8J2QWI8_9NEOP|nr:unnamed protein product [Danaus chrysippus]